MYFSDAELDSWIEEDVPYGDLTTQLLGFGDSPGTISYAARYETVACATEEAARMFAKLGLRATKAVPTGTVVPAGEVFFAGEGSADAIHCAWKSCGRVLEGACGVATRTRRFVEAARSGNPSVVVATTRKSFPGTKKLVSKAVLAGGAVFHRLGLSETVLVFDEHIRFLGGLDAFLARLPALKAGMPEKKIVAEAHDAPTAEAMILAGVDVVQCDKFSPAALREAADAARKANSGSSIAAAGNVTLDNVAEIAATGVAFVVTSALFSGKPSDIGVTISPTRKGAV